MPPTGPEHSRTLLVVDDEPRVLAALKEVLERQGFAVCASPDPRHALELLRQRDFAVVLTDHLMPAMSGMDLLIECRQLQPHATRVLITAALSLPTLVDAMNKGEIYRFLAKPWLREELIATVRNAINRHELVVQNERLLLETAELKQRIAAADGALAEQVAQLDETKRALALATRDKLSRQDRSLELCLQLLDTYDPLLGRKARTIADLSARMAGAADFLDAEERDLLRVAGRLCDLGLIALPRAMLQQLHVDPSRLGRPELDALHYHPIYSQTLAAHLDDRARLGETIRAHHERFDGSGYPDGRSGAAIPRVARCLAVAVWVAESGLNGPGAAAALERETGRALDPLAVRLFLGTTRLDTLPRPVRELGAEELKPGMVLANGIYSPQGLLLVGEGQPLSHSTIARIRSHQLVDPLEPRFLIYL